jgi:hypothetical protein
VVVEVKAHEKQPVKKGTSLGRNRESPEGPEMSNCWSRACPQLHFKWAVLSRLRPPLAAAIPRRLTSRTWWEEDSPLFRYCTGEELPLPNYVEITIGSASHCEGPSSAHPSRQPQVRQLCSSKRHCRLYFQTYLLRGTPTPRLPTHCGCHVSRIATVTNELDGLNVLHIFFTRRPTQCALPAPVSYPVDAPTNLQPRLDSALGHARGIRPCLSRRSIFEGRPQDHADESPEGVTFEQRLRALMSQQGDELWTFADREERNIDGVSATSRMIVVVYGSCYFE